MRISALWQWWQKPQEEKNYHITIQSTQDNKIAIYSNGQNLGKLASMKLYKLRQLTIEERVDFGGFMEAPKEESYRDYLDPQGKLQYVHNRLVNYILSQKDNKVSDKTVFSITKAIQMINNIQNQIYNQTNVFDPSVYNIKDDLISDEFMKILDKIAVVRSDSQISSEKKENENDLFCQL